MNKLIQGMLIIAVLALAVSPAAIAATQSSSPVTVSAVVNSALSLNVTLKQNSSTGTTVTAMNFGTLQSTGTGNLISSTGGSTGTGSVVAVINANTQTAPYVITQTGTALTSNGNTIPTGACQVVPVYAPEDNGGASLPAGAALGSAGSWVATDKILYDSENSNAALRTIQAHYAITESASGVVPPTQPAGTYSGTVTFTVTTS